MMLKLYLRANLCIILNNVELKTRGVFSEIIKKTTLVSYALLKCLN